jgi:hypothetical protein
VWVGDPDGYTKMEDIPEFVEAGVPKVQGGTFPARIWGMYSEAAMATLPVEDWAAPPPPPPPAARQYHPREECAYKVISGGTSATTTTVPGEPAEPGAPPASTPGDGSPTDSTAVPTTVPVVIQLVPDQTTIPPTQLDPRAPVPTVDLRTTVQTCSKLPGIVVNTSKP